MANTTFNGPVRSENGFEQISIAAKTGTVTTNLDVDSSGNITTTGYLSAYANVSSITDATKSVESTDSGTVYTLNRAAGIVVTLPTAVAGINYTFIVGTIQANLIFFIITNFLDLGKFGGNSEIINRLECNF